MTYVVRLDELQTILTDANSALLILNAWCMTRATLPPIQPLNLKRDGKRFSLS
jgi:hypothetical protein